jgi:glycosyltransferase involved in cell wall biosynthesis
VDLIGIKFSQKLLVVSSKLKKVYQERYRIPKEKIYIVPNNIEKRYHIDPDERNIIRRSLGIDPKDFLISTSGVFNEGKNFPFLIRAMKHLYVNQIKLAIIGDEVVNTGERYRLEKLTRDLELQNHVMFCGWQDNPCRFVASSDLFVFPSKYEGSPNSLLEALGCGIPCFGSQIDEIEEILKYEELLFPLEQEGFLADRIILAKNDHSFYQRVKYLSDERCKHFLFDWEKEVLRLSLK